MFFDDGDMIKKIICHWCKLSSRLPNIPLFNFVNGNWYIYFVYSLEEIIELYQLRRSQEYEENGIGQYAEGYPNLLSITWIWDGSIILGVFWPVWELDKERELLVQKSERSTCSEMWQDGSPTWWCSLNYQQSLPNLVLKKAISATGKLNH